MRLLTATGRAMVRLFVPEGLLLATLVAAGAFAPVGDRLLPFLELIAGAVLASGFIIGWRFGRGRVVLGLLVLAAAAALPLVQAGPGRSLLGLLVPVNLALIALLPDRGIATRTGMVWLATLLVQGTAVLLLAGSGPGSSDPLAAVAVPGLAAPVAAPLLAFGAALTALTVRALVGGGAPARGLLWATAAALVAWLGVLAPAPFVLIAGGLVLVIAALEDAHALAYRDALTGLPSRRALDELLDRTARHYTVAMIDVDHFKQFNDRHGHDVGDQVLRMVAARLQEVGGGARAFRYGGEEFTLVFRGRTLEDARPFLEEARSRIESSKFVVRSADRPAKKPKKKRRKKSGSSADKPRLFLFRSRPRRQQLSVTVSVGAAERMERGSAPADVVRAADAALYRAKRSGRNRVAA